MSLNKIMEKVVKLSDYQILRKINVKEKILKKELNILKNKAIIQKLTKKNYN